MDVITAEYRELSGCQSMGLSKSGSLCLIAGKRYYIHLFSSYIFRVNFLFLGPTA